MTINFLDEAADLLHSKAAAAGYGSDVARYVAQLVASDTPGAHY